MDAALVGGAFLAASLQVLFDRMASREFLDFFKGQKLDDKLLKQLKSTMRAVNKVLNDAEKKQITDPAVKEWADELKDAVYEADDLLDEIAYEALRAKLEAGTQSSVDQVQNFFSSLIPFNNGVNAKLEEILQSLEYLVQQMDVLGLKEGSGEKPLSYKAPTTSLVDESGVCGRDKDKEAMLKLLLSDDANDNIPGVIAIVGMGGVGKTTLAQLVYKDTTVQRFDLKAWVCVSLEFDPLKVTKDILKEVGLENCDAMTSNRLHIELEKRVTGKNFLLVLDDVWSDDRGDWEFLLTPLKSGLRQGSKTIITTRHGGAASVVSTVLADIATVSSYPLCELSLDDCWFVFARHAFDGGSSSAQGDLEEIGKKIVEKCKGLPLAAKVLGGLLRSNTDAEEWEKVLDSNMWDLQDNGILPALRLSYYYLPSHLKQCFAYCVLFPPDYEFQKEDLVPLWMAEGFLEQGKGKEMDGNKCFDDLVSRYEDDEPSKPSEKARYLSYAMTKHDAVEATSEGLCGAQFLRSFLLFKPKWWKYMPYNRMLDFLQSLEHLQVLSLCHHRVEFELLNSIGNLKHIRYLNLRNAAIKRLPESVSNLYYLQTLILYGCNELVELPTNMMKLINMCHLDIRHTNVQLMPPQMGKLMKLQRLINFFAGKQSGSSIKELGKLQLLRELCIWNLQNVVNVQDAAEANLKSKKQLRELELTWGCYNDDSSEEVLEQLQPHTKMESLSIHKYGGIKFPNWVGDSSFSNIVSLNLTECAHCSSLPPLGHLASLKDLTIIDFDAIETVDLNFYGSCSFMKEPFGSLETLRFERIPKWQKWICDIGGAFPVLRELYIIKCPNLTKALPNHLPSLTELEIIHCDQLVASLPRAPSILEMTRQNFFHFRFMKLKKLAAGLQSLEVRGLDSFDSALKGIEQMGVVFTALKEIHIVWCDFESLCAHEESLGNFISLELLKIVGCPNLQSLGIQHLTSLKKLTIFHCEHVSFTERLPSSLSDLQIWGCLSLAKRCEREKGEDWPKISHIPNMFIR